MCKDVFENENVAKNSLMNYLIDLSNDSIVNVKITLAKLISKLFKHKSNIYVNT
jgi:hypothetical protein